MSHYDFTIVVPVYKSVDTLEPLYHGVKELMDAEQRTFELIYVEDSGSEPSWQELLRLKNAHPNEVKIVRLSRNFGQNGATLCGIDLAQGDKLITIDDDMQTPPSELKKLIDFQKESNADVIYGRSSETQSSWLRRVGGNFVKRIFNKNEGGSSIGSSIRLVDRHIVEKLRFHSQDHLFINQVISWYTVNFEFVDVERSTREEGKSGYSLFKLIVLSLRLIFYYTSIPLKIVIFFSLLGALGMMAMTIYYISYHIGAGDELDLFMIAVLLSMAMIAGSISVFGMYINRIYSARVKRPNYAIKVKL